jgi:hypothetical protein
VSSRDTLRPDFFNNLTQLEVLDISKSDFVHIDTYDIFLKISHKKYGTVDKFEGFEKLEIGLYGNGTTSSKKRWQRSQECKAISF